jgi:hypothetical protein
MTKAEPLELADAVKERLNGLTLSLGHLRTVSQFERRLIERDISNVEKTDAPAGSLLRAMLATLDGDVERLDYYLSNARKLGASADHVDNLELVALANLGLAKRGLSLARRTMRAGRPDLSPLFLSALGVGAATTVARVIDEANAEGQLLAKPANDFIALARKVSKALAESNHIEDELSALLDLAGEILRRERLLWLDSCPRIVARTSDDRIDEPSGVHYFFRIDKPPREAARLSTELARRIVVAGLDFDELGVNFTGTTLHAASA